MMSARHVRFAREDHESDIEGSSVRADAGGGEAGDEQRPLRKPTLEDDA
jgi:hypothetical protein